MFEESFGLRLIAFSKLCTKLMKKDFWGRITYGFEGVCIQSDTYHGDGSELLKADICSNDILVNKNRNIIS